MDYRDKIYDFYLSSGFAEMNTQDFERISRSYTLNYSRILPLKNKNIKILDLGCGMGHFLFFLKKMGYEDFWGIDISKEQIEFCRKNVTHRVELVENVNDFLSGKENTYDIIVMNHFLEHFKKCEIIHILSLVRYSLKKAGRLIINTPNMGSLFASASRYIDFTHEVGLSEQSLHHVLASCGYKTINFYAEKIFISSPVKRLMFNIINKCYVALLKLLIFIERPGDAYPSIVSKNLIACVKK